MLRKVLLLSTISFLFSLESTLEAHCQLPCGIYHDNMVYDQVDQFVETVYKGISVMNDSKFNSVKDKNEFIRWVIEKEKSCNDTAELITKYFLQQKIKPDEDDTVKRIVSAHKLLFMLTAIKQNTDLDFVKQFIAEWEKFKLMFHREGYECEMEKKQFKEVDALRKVQEAKAKEEAAKEDAAKGETAHVHPHSHSHSHPHTHTH